MIDFLKANPSFTMHDYLWVLTYPQILLASIDFSHIEYDDDDYEDYDIKSNNKKEKVKKISLDSEEDLLSALGINKK